VVKCYNLEVTFAKVLRARLTRRVLISVRCDLCVVEFRGSVVARVECQDASKCTLSLIIVIVNSFIVGKSRVLPVGQIFDGVIYIIHERFVR
jgi:hypothetical protein